MDDPSHYADLAEQLAVAGGRLALEGVTTAASTIKEDNSVVTDLDYRVQELIIAGIRRHWPDHAIVGEENTTDAHAPDDTTSSRTGSSVCWVIDPIDGTRSYARNLPGFCTSIGIMIDGTPVAGVIYEPCTGTTYRAVAGQGATRNAIPIQVAAQAPALNEWVISVPSGTRKRLPAYVHKWLDTYAIRAFGSAALHLALVAAGCMDACLSAWNAKLWDVAAGYVLVTEAGGHFLPLDGKDLFPVDPVACKDRSFGYLAASPVACHALAEDIHNRVC